jgi:hypothetical protein
MQGVPVTRVMSADGRWAYTLYQSLDGVPFIHALDTAGRTAACIDLDDLTNDELSEARLVLAGGTLRVDGPAGPLALVDTRTFAVRAPAPPRAAAPAPAAPAPARDDAGGGVPWELTLLAFVPLVGLAVVSRRRRRRVAARH